MRILTITLSAVAMMSMPLTAMAESRTPARHGAMASHGKEKNAAPAKAAATGSASGEKSARASTAKLKAKHANR